MALKAMNIKLEETKIEDIKTVASTFNMTMTDVINKALDSYLEEMKRDPLYMLTANVSEACEEESKEILEALSRLTEEDLSLSSSRKIEI